MMDTDRHSNIDWRQVIVNLETQLVVDGYSYGLWNDLRVARAEAAKERKQ